jgi:UDP-2-acetamido-2-deoxy-ribo-hexuluronate aminotransferase
MEFIDLKAQQNRIRRQISKRIDQVLEHGKYILGPEVSELEEKLASYVGVKHCIGVGNWTDGLTVCLMALGIKPGDEVITPSFSFFATTEAIVLLGATPVFVDVDPRTYNLDVKLLEKAITPKTKCILPVSLYGQCADLTSINQIANRYQIPVLEDAAQSFGASINGKKSCSFTTLSGTSFFPSKPLGAYGDGGACFTDDDDLASILRQIRAHGQEGRYNHVRIGVNSRLDTIQAAILLEKFSIFESEIEQRQEVASWYDDFLSDSVQTPFIADGHRSVYAQYTIEVEQRERVAQHLLQNGIPTCVHYPLPLHLQPALKFLGESGDSLSHSERVAERVLSLPFHPYLTKPEIGRIASAIREAIKKVA